MPTASQVKFNDFTEQLGKGNHNLSTGVLKVALTNSAPSAANTVLADITQISAGNGYTTGGETVPSTAYTESGGTGTLVGNSITWTGSGAGMATFRYAVLYNSSSTGVTNGLISYTDYGVGGVTVAAGETFKWRPSSTDTGGTILTVA